MAVYFADPMDVKDIGVLNKMIVEIAGSIAGIQEDEAEGQGRIEGGTFEEGTSEDAMEMLYQDMIDMRREWLAQIKERIRELTPCPTT